MSVPATRPARGLVPTRTLAPFVTHRHVIAWHPRLPFIAAELGGSVALRVSTGCGAWGRRGCSSSPGAMPGCRSTPLPVTQTTASSWSKGLVSVLKSATAVAAAALGRRDLGVLAPWKAADMLAAQGYALHDIRALTAPRLVMARGRVVACTPGGHAEKVPEEGFCSHRDCYPSTPHRLAPWWDRARTRIRERHGHSRDGRAARTPNQSMCTTSEALVG